VALSHSPSIVTNGLVLCLDAANRKGYDKFENLMTSSQLGNTILNDGGAVTLTTDTTIASPFGGSDGVLKCVHTTQTPGYFRRGQNMSLTAGVTYTFSFYFKNGTVSNPYGQNPVNNLGILASTYSPTFEEPSQSLNTNIDVGNGWYRQVFTFTPTYTQTYQVDFSQTVNQTPIGTYYLYGFQLERGSSVTDYYATTSTAKNRGTIWSDLSGRGNTGTLINSVGYSNSNSGSFVFDGVDDNIQLSNASNFISSSQSSITINFWVKTNVTGVYKKIFITGTTGTSSVSGTYFSIGPSPYQVYFGIITNNGTQQAIYTTNLSTTQYSNLCGTYDGSNIRLYLNGTQVAIQSQTGNIVNTGIARISGYDNNTEVWNGNISTAQIYNRALTAAEVQQNFNALRGRFGI
jgi:hypothetical protein